MAGRGRDGDSFFRDSRRDWISDRATRREDFDVGNRRERDRSPLGGNRDRDDRVDWSNDKFSGDRLERGAWNGRRSKSPDRRADGGSRDRVRSNRLSAERDGRRNTYRENRGREEESIQDRSSRNVDCNSRFDGGRDLDRPVVRHFSGDRERGSSRPANQGSRDRSPLNDDDRGFRDRAINKPDNETSRWDNRDRFGRDRSRNRDRPGVENSPRNENSGFEPTRNAREQELSMRRNVDNWGRELRLGGDRGINTRLSPERPPRSGRRPSLEKERDRDISVDRNLPSRSRDKDWKKSVDDFLCPRGSQGSSPSSRPRSRDRQDPDCPNWVQTDDDWDREVKKFDRKKTSIPTRSGVESRDPSPPRKKPQDRRSLDRTSSKDGHSRDYGSRSRAPNLSPKHNKPRDRTPVVDEKSDGEDMVISDEDVGSKDDVDEWENMVLMKYKNDNSPSDKFHYRHAAPQKTVLVRSLPADVSEEDIHRNITTSNLVCHDIRLVRSKNTGYSRGFAFVEFYTASDAAAWIEKNKGVLKYGKFKCYMEYSAPRNPIMQQQGFAPSRHVSDWICTRCKAHNFSKRFLCYTCNSSRTFSDAEEWDVQASDHPSRTVVLVGLDVLTSEETILKSIASLSEQPIRSVKVARDPLTKISKGACYLEMNNALDAFNLFYKLKGTVPEIEGRRPVVKYAKPAFQAASQHSKPSGNIGNTAIAAAQWSHQSNEGAGEQYTLDDVPRLAEYSAAMYATTPQEKMTYFSYYQNYYKKQITEGNPVYLPVDSASGLASAQVALSSSTTVTSSTSTVAGPSDPPDGSGTTTYPIPNTALYQYDPSSSFYYDPYTKLYYDANSQYYYNSKLSKYLYWDASRMTYLPTPSSAELPEMSQADQTDPNKTQNAVIVGAPQPAVKVAKKKDKDNDGDRVKVAKRIAKDMEKWAKTLNQKKETAKSSVAPAFAANPAANSKFGPTAGAADIGFAVLERKDHLSTLGNYYDTVSRKNEVSSSVLLPPMAESDEEDETSEDKSHTDWDRLICLLCKRQLGSREALVKHQQISDLHKQNLAAWYKSKGLDPDDAQLRQNQYRDRASERRQKYGVPDTPKPSRLKESYIKTREAVFEQPTSKGIGSENKGNKLLQKMGWQEGMGLGRTNQGRTSIIEASRRTASAGLGSRGATGGVTPGPGETYKDCVKKMMAVRYAQLEGQE